MGRKKKIDMDSDEKMQEEAPKVWTFISKYRGYSFPDPRSKPPADPHLASRWMPRIIQFIHGVYQTRDADEARAIYGRWKSTKAMGGTPDFQPIDRESAERYLEQSRPKLQRGSLSIESARANHEVRYPIPPAPEPIQEPEPTEKPSIRPELEDEFAPAPSRE